MVNGSHNWAMVSSDTRKQSFSQNGQHTSKNMPAGAGVFIGLNTLSFMHEGIGFGKPDKKNESLNALLTKIDVDETVLNRFNFYGLFGARAQKIGVPKEWLNVKAIYVRGNIQMSIVKEIREQFAALLSQPQYDSSTPSVALEQNPAFSTTTNNAYLNSKHFQAAHDLGQRRSLIFNGNYSEADLAINDQDPEAASLYLRYIDILLINNNLPMISIFDPAPTVPVNVRGAQFKSHVIDENNEFEVTLHTTLGFLNNYRWNGQGSEYKNLQARKGTADGSDFWTVTLSSWKTSDIPNNILAVFPEKIRGVIERADRLRINYVMSSQNASVLDRIINLKTSDKYSDALVMFAGKGIADISSMNGTQTRRKFVNPYKTESGEKIVEINVRQGTFVTIRNF